MRPPPRSSAEREKRSRREEKRKEREGEKRGRRGEILFRETRICRLGQELKEGEGERVEILAISSIDPLPRFSLSLFFFQTLSPRWQSHNYCLWTETCAEHGWKKQISTIAGGEFPLPFPAQFRFSDEGFRLVAFCPSPFERYRRPRHSVYSETLSV